MSSSSVYNLEVCRSYTNLHLISLRRVLIWVTFMLEPIVVDFGVFKTHYSLVLYMCGAV